jgi:LemA protein
MNNKRYAIYIIGGILILLGIYMFTSYNAMVKKDEGVKLAWNEVQNAYQRRIDFIPNVVNIVKGQANFEQGTLEQIAAARAKAITQVNAGLTSQSLKAQEAAQNELATATNRLIIAVEKYPELQSAKAFEGLQTQLEGTERRVKFARKDFNAAIADYNSYVKAFPAKLVAGMFGFPAKDGFSADSGAEKAIEITFNQ